MFVFTLIQIYYPELYSIGHVFHNKLNWMKRQKTEDISSDYERGSREYVYIGIIYNTNYMMLPN